VADENIFHIVATENWFLEAPQNGKGATDWAEKGYLAWQRNRNRGRIKKDVQV